MRSKRHGKRRSKRRGKRRVGSKKHPPRLGKYELRLLMTVARRNEQHTGPAPPVGWYSKTAWRRIHQLIVAGLLNNSDGVTLTEAGRAFIIANGL
jgi:hypothetical protein